MLYYCTPLRDAAVGFPSFYTCSLGGLISVGLSPFGGCSMSCQQPYHVMLHPDRDQYDDRDHNRDRVRDRAAYVERREMTPQSCYRGLASFVV